jgi:hypothetical protein
LGLALALLPSQSLLAAAPEPAAVAAALDAETRESLSRTVRGILVESLPERIEDSENWGEKRSIFSGFKIERDGGKLKVEKRTKDVNHGLWRQIQVTPVKPADNLKFQIVDAHSVGPRRVAFQVLVSAPLKVSARIERWRSGIKMLNMNTDADATIEMRLAGELEHRFESDGSKRSLVVSPEVKTVDLRLVEFDWQRIGRLEGWAVHELGEALTGPIAKRLDRHEPKVVEKLNATLAKHREKLRVTMKLPFDFSGWSLPSGS